MTTEHAVSAYPDGGYFQVASARSRKVYRVTPTASGSATCECYWWIKTHEACSHIRSVREFAAKVLKDGGGAKRFAGHTRPTGSTPGADMVGGRFESGGALADSQAAVLPSLPQIDPLKILSHADREIAEYAGLSPAMARAWKAEKEPHA